MSVSEGTLFEEARLPILVRMLFGCFFLEKSQRFSFFCKVGPLPVISRSYTTPLVNTPLYTTPIFVFGPSFIGAPCHSN